MPRPTCPRPRNGSLPSPIQRPCSAPPPRLPQFAENLSSIAAVAELAEQIHRSRAFPSASEPTAGFAEARGAHFSTRRSLLAAGTELSSNAGNSSDRRFQLSVAASANSTSPISTIADHRQDLLGRRLALGDEQCVSLQDQAFEDFEQPAFEGKCS
ncbi:uncharacterized protein LOC133905298 [Phragmites australis]|uniref:uncharacterized protein LOC133905298 n=1 Tax=Phragmites australis TaxID=29695 RepID=UPI002D767D85|nr:uncharacterized protein LOC133905298 [Phragmites australis]